MKMKKVLKNFHIETSDGGGSFNFFTSAEDHKKALRLLQTNSHDFKRIVRKNRDLTITVKEIK